jgi:hypothetical protein
MSGAGHALGGLFSTVGTDNAKTALEILELYSYTVPDCEKTGDTIYAAKGFGIPASLTIRGRPPRVDPFGWVRFDKRRVGFMARSLRKELGFVMNVKVMMLSVFFFWDYMAHIQVPQWLTFVFYHGEALANGGTNIEVLVPDGEEGRRYALTQGENRGACRCVRFRGPLRKDL